MTREASQYERIFFHKALIDKRSTPHYKQLTHLRSLKHISKKNQFQTDSSEENNKHDVKLAFTA